MSIFIQGVGTEFEKCFFNGDEVWYLKSNCFGDLSDTHVGLQINHDGKNLASTDNRLEVLAGKEALIFRLSLPDSFADDLRDQKDEFESYIPISVGLTATQTDSVKIDGVPVTVVTKATLREISVLDKPPAIPTTYARVVSEDTCNDLAADYDMIRLVGRFVSLHRAQKATENDGRIEYKHSLSAYDAAANRFARAIARLQ